MRRTGMTAQIGKDLSGKVAVVTGASSGIGAASARLFAAAGARVVVGYNKGIDRANAVVGGLAGSGHKAMHLPLEDSGQIRKVAAAVREEFRVIVVAPGMVHTGFVPGRTEEMMAKAAATTPLKRAIEPEDVALAVISCVTHLTHTTGSIVSVDAGRHL